MARRRAKALPAAASANASAARLPKGAVDGPRLPDAPGLVLVVDTREQAPLDFTGLCPFVVAGLKTGDYSFVGAEHAFCVERKGLADLHGTVISDRPRFTREIERMAHYEYAAILIEGTVGDVLSFTLPPRAAAHFTPAQLMAHPRTIINSLLSWEIEYGIHVHFVSTDRNLCRALVLSLARRFWRKKHPPGSAASASSSSPSPSGSEAPAA